jgi:hypothetical protein
MKRISIHLVYQSDLGRPLTAVRLDDPDLIIQVAKKAIDDAHKEASAISELDGFVGQVKKEEAIRLERVLKNLVPELDMGGKTNA